LPVDEDAVDVLLMSTVPPIYSLARVSVERKRRQAFEAFRAAYDAQLRRDYRTAVEQYRQSIACYPTAEAHTFLGWAYSFQGELESAIEECRQAIRLDPEFGNPYNDIGAYLIARGRHDEAAPYLQRALESKRYQACHFAHFNLGRVREHQGDILSALRHYKKALDAEPGYAVASEAIEQLKRRTAN
jgi:Tfp pilus assembly protein PilF